MKRRLLNFATALSLALCAAVLALWVRSTYVEDQVMWRRVDGARWVVTSPGYVVFGMELANWSGWPADAFGLSHTRADPLPPALNRVDQEWQHLAQRQLDFLPHRDCARRHLRRDFFRPVINAQSTLAHAGSFLTEIPSMWLAAAASRALAAQRRKATFASPYIGRLQIASLMKVCEPATASGRRPTAGMSLILKILRA